MENDNLMIKEKQITALVTAYYEKFDFLQKGELSVLIDKALNKYLNTDLTLEEINEDMMNRIIDRKRKDDLDNKNEIDNMIKEEFVEENNIELEKPKVFIKADNNERGFVHYRGLIVPYIVLVLIVVIMEIFKFVS